MLMKYIKIKLVLLIFTLSFSACKDEKSNIKESDLAFYQCPMKCEGEKTFNQSKAAVLFVKWI